MKFTEMWMLSVAGFLFIDRPVKIDPVQIGFLRIKSIYLPISGHFPVQIGFHRSIWPFLRVDFHWCALCLEYSGCDQIYIHMQTEN